MKNDKIVPVSKHNGLYEVILAMKYLRSSDKDWNEFREALEGLILRYKDVVELEKMNFPLDWKEHMIIAYHKNQRINSRE